MKRIAQLMLVLCSLCFACSKQTGLSEAQFSKEFAEAVQKSSPGVKVEIVDSLHLKLTGTNGTSASSFLDNAFKEYEKNPAKKNEIISKYAAVGLESFKQDKIPITREQIVPLVKDKPYLDEMRAGMKQAGYDKLPEYVWDEINEDLVVLYAVDRETSLAYLSQADLEKLKVQKTELRALACGNLRRILPEVKYRGRTGSYMITADGTYEASLLLLDSVWDTNKMSVKGNFVFAIPARDLLFVTGSEDAQGVEHLRTVVKKAAKQASHRLTDQLFVYEKGKISRFK